MEFHLATSPLDTFDHFQIVPNIKKAGPRSFSEHILYSKHLYIARSQYPHFLREDFLAKFTVYFSLLKGRLAKRTERILTILMFKGPSNEP